MPPSTAMTTDNFFPELCDFANVDFSSTCVIDDELAAQYPPLDFDQPLSTLFSSTAYEEPEAVYDFTITSSLKSTKRGAGTKAKQNEAKQNGVERRSNKMTHRKMIIAAFAQSGKSQLTFGELVYWLRTTFPDEQHTVTFLRTLRFTLSRTIVNGIRLFQRTTREYEQTPTDAGTGKARPSKREPVWFIADSSVTAPTNISQSEWDGWLAELNSLKVNSLYTAADKKKSAVQLRAYLESVFDCL